MRAREDHAQGIVGCDPRSVRVERAGVEVPCPAIEWPITADYELAPPTPLTEGFVARIVPHAWDGARDLFGLLDPAEQMDILAACLAKGEALAAELEEVTFEDTIG